MGIVYYKERKHSNQRREEVQRAGPGNYQSGASVVCGVRALLSWHWCVTLCMEYGQPRKLTWTVVFRVFIGTLWHDHDWLSVRLISVSSVQGLCAWPKAPILHHSVTLCLAQGPRQTTLRLRSRSWSQRPAFGGTFWTRLNSLLYRYNVNNTIFQNECMSKAKFGFDLLCWNHCYWEFLGIITQNGNSLKVQLGSRVFQPERLLELVLDILRPTNSCLSCNCPNINLSNHSIFFLLYTVLDLLSPKAKVSFLFFPNFCFVFL